MHEHAQRFRIDGGNAVVTGGANGIGRAIAVGLAEAGARVAVIDLPQMAGEAAETLRAIAAAGGEGRFYPLDVAQVPKIAPAIARIAAELGPLAIFVNDAGVGSNMPAFEIEEAEWDRVLGVNLKGMFFCAVAAARHMREHGGGRIINITAGDAAHHAVLSMSSAYSASKGGVIALTKSLALQWAPYGILVNCVGPGSTNTPMVRRTDAAHGRDEATVRERAARTIPLGRRLEPDEIAAAVVFLAGPAGGAIVGQNIVVDGGSSIT